MRSESFNLRPSAAAFERRLSQVVGSVIAATVALDVLALSLARARFIHAFFVSFGFLTTLGLGALFFTLLHFAVGARWSLTSTRRLRAVAGLLPWCALLFVPIVFWVNAIFPWSRTLRVGNHSTHFASYLSFPWFYIRAVVYWLAWGCMVAFFGKPSDELATSDATSRARFWSAPALILFAITTTFASFDWFMSLQTNWHSAVFGVYVFSGAVCGGLALLGIITVLLDRWAPTQASSNVETRHDIGKLLFGFVVFWAYIAFSQYLLIWYAGLASETPFFTIRFGRFWLPTTITLFALHFALPFLLLLGARAKRSPIVLLVAAGVVLMGHGVDFFWLVMPALKSAWSPWNVLADISGAMIAISGVLTSLLRAVRAERRRLESRQTVGNFQALERALSVEAMGLKG